MYTLLSFQKIYPLALQDINIDMPFFFIYLEVKQREILNLILTYSFNKEKSWAGAQFDELREMMDFRLSIPLFGNFFSAAIINEGKTELSYSFIRCFFVAYEKISDELW